MQVNDNNQTRRTVVTLAGICMFVQLALVPQIGLANGRANLMLVFATSVALRYGGNYAVVCGFLAGLFFDLTTTGPIGLMAFELTLASYLLGRDGRNRFTEGPTACFGFFAAANGACALVYNLAMLFVGESRSFFGLVFLRALPTFLLTCVPFVVVYYFLAIRGGSSSFFVVERRLNSARGHHLGTRGSHLKMRDM